MPKSNAPSSLVELTDAELKAVSGGSSIVNPPPSSTTNAPSGPGPNGWMPPPFAPGPHTQYEQ